MNFKINEDNYKIRSEQKQDYEGIRQVNIDAFEQNQEAHLIDAIRNSEWFVPELSIVCENNEQELIGHILFSKIGLITKEGHNKVTLGLAPLAVKTQFHNSGIGSKLVNYGLFVCKRLGFEHVFVLGHPNYYPHFGFKSTKPMGIEAPIPVPPEVFMGLELKHNSLKEVTGVIKYPPAFEVVS